MMIYLLGDTVFNHSCQCWEILLCESGIKKRSITEKKSLCNVRVMLVETLPFSGWSRIDRTPLVKAKSNLPCDRVLEKG